MEINELVEIFGKHPVQDSIIQHLKSNKEFKIRLKGLSGSSSAIIISQIFKETERNLLVVLSDKEEAVYSYNDLSKISQNLPVFLLPSSFKRELSVKDDYKKSEGNIILRNRAIEALGNNRKAILVTYPEALIEKETNIETHKKASFSIHRGEKISTSFLRDFLHEYGFTKTDFVFGPGDFSIRGSIIDVFSFSDEYPYRIDLFGDEVESIRTFDVMSQLSVAKMDKITIHPDVNKLSLKNEKSVFFDLLSKDTIIWMKDYQYLFDKTELICNRIASLKPVSNDGLNMIETEDFSDHLALISKLNSFSHIILSHTGNLNTDCFFEFSQSKQPDFNKNFNLLAENMKARQDEGFKNYILSSNPKQLERLTSILHSDEVKIKVDFIPVTDVLHEGFNEKDLKISIYTDHQIFGRFHRVKLLNEKLSENKSVHSFKEIASLQPGDFVVHADYGIGKFGGINTIENNGKKQETIRIIYKNNDVVFVSIHSLHKVSKYRGGEGVPPVLSKLGTGAWQKMKERTKSKVKDIAKELIALYAKRKDEKGFQFSSDTYLQEALEASFIYEDTPDQSKATIQTKADMESDLPMDRLICGDVGFGKTEVAIRAAFKAVTDGKQVAVLVPTTILALQHFQTFSKRLSPFSCRVEYISRMKSQKAQTEIINELAKGKIDILIGTHRLVSKDIVFKDLGLLIIDEEQKFGVSIKEKLKQLKLNLDTLTLTATPIPRTLQFSLMGARDLSVINTPPPDRYPIITQLHTFNEEILKEAIEFEVHRNGQVFIIHNRVENIAEIKKLVNRICPNVKTVFAHGQMKGNELEKIMLDFINQDFDVLIATTIIESGLDISNANTIIINNAQNFGLSDLHQLRGRVGRSNKRAYCYLLAPPLSVLSNEARKRLNAIEEFSDLGSGFNIALQDLDIRGAGNLLGAEQSGFIADIGFETYQQILNEALFEIQEENKDELVSKSIDDNQRNSYLLPDCQIDTDFELIFPESYISNTAERIRLYRELDSLKDEQSLYKFEEELHDRFGNIPPQTKDLFIAVRLRWVAQLLGFSKIILKNETMYCHFHASDSSEYFNSVTFTGILAYVNKNPMQCRLREQKDKLVLQIERIKSIKEAYNSLKKMEIS
ncbi:MAG: transcription-repair coupling factor [Bacteroidales bacterium]